MQAEVRLNGRREQGGAEAPQRVGARAAARSLPAEDLLPRLLRRWGVLAAPWQPAVAQLSPLLDWTDAVHLAQALSSGDAAATDPIELRPLHAAAQAALHRLGSEMRADFADALLERDAAALPEQVQQARDKACTDRGPLHRRDHRHRTLVDGARHLLVVKSPQVSHRAAAAADDDHVDVRGQAFDRGGDLRRGRGTLHRAVGDQDADPPAARGDL